MANGILDSVFRGAGQGATFGFNDEAVAKILANLPMPDDGTGIPREYSAGSPEQDYLNTERASNADAASSHPVAYGVGSVAGGLPSALATPAGVGGSAAARIAAGGLSGGLLGGLSGAGHADGNDIGNAIGKGAALGAGLGTAGSAAIEGIPYAKAVLNQMDSFAPEPAMAGGGRAAQLPPRPTTEDMPRDVFIPKAPKALMPEEAVGASEDLADASMASNTAKANFGKEGSERAAARGQAQKSFDEARTGVRAKPASSTKASVPAKPRGKAAQRAETVRAPAATGEGAQTVPAPAPEFTPSTFPTQPPPAGGMPTVPAPAPTGTASMRPTMMDLGPVKPTLRPPSEQAYKDAVLRALADGLR